MRRWNALLVCLLAACLTSSTAIAVVIAPGTTIPLAGTTEALRPELAGPIIEDVSLPYTISDAAGALATGEIQNRVVREAGGTLDFYWAVIPSPNSRLPIDSLRTRGFADFGMDVDFRIDGTGDLGPQHARAFTGADLGAVNFLFDDTVLQPNQRSLFMFIKTTATSYALVGATDVTSPGAANISNNLQTFAPVPEPAALGLLAFAALGLIRRR